MPSRPRKRILGESDDESEEQSPSVSRADIVPSTGGRKRRRKLLQTRDDDMYVDDDDVSTVRPVTFVPTQALSPGERPRAPRTSAPADRKVLLNKKRDQMKALLANQHATRQGEIQASLLALERKARASPRGSPRVTTSVTSAVASAVATSPAPPLPRMSSSITPLRPLPKGTPTPTPEPATYPDGITDGNTARKSGMMLQAAEERRSHDTTPPRGGVDVLVWDEAPIEDDVRMDDGDDAEAFDATDVGDTLASDTHDHAPSDTQPQVQDHAEHSAHHSSPPTPPRDDERMEDDHDNSPAEAPPSVHSARPVSAHSCSPSAAQQTQQTNSPSPQQEGTHIPITSPIAASAASASAGIPDQHNASPAPLFESPGDASLFSSSPQLVGDWRAKTPATPVPPPFHSPEQHMQPQRTLTPEEVVMMAGGSFPQVSTDSMARRLERLRSETEQGDSRATIQRLQQEDKRLDTLSEALQRRKEVISDTLERLEASQLSPTMATPRESVGWGPISFVAKWFSPRPSEGG